MGRDFFGGPGNSGNETPALGLRSSVVARSLQHYSPKACTLTNDGGNVIRSAVRSLVTVLLWVLLLSSCTAMTGKTAGQNVDDATITPSVKAKLATQEAASTLTRVGVNTDRGIVHLDGIV